MNHPNAHAGWGADAHRIIDAWQVAPGLPIPYIAPARATFDYRHIVHAEDARDAVACAQAALSDALGVTFAPPRTELAGDGTPRYLLEAVLPSGLVVVIAARVRPAGDLDAPAERENERELARAAA